MNFLTQFDVTLASTLDTIIANTWGLGGGSRLLQVGLFNTNRAPVKSDLLATYTAMECSFPGYARVSMHNTDFSPSVVVASVAISVGGTATFVRSSPAGPAETGFGFFVWDFGTNTVLWAQLFDVPTVFTLAGDSLIFSLQFTYDSAH